MEAPIPDLASGAEQLSMVACDLEALSVEHASGVEAVAQALGEIESKHELALPWDFAARIRQEAIHSIRKVHSISRASERLRRA